jgi:hypothetical protein
MDELESNIPNVNVEISARQCSRIRFVVLGYVRNPLVHSLSISCNKSYCQHLTLNKLLG